MGYEALNSANVRVSNKLSEDRTYDITSNVSIQDGKAVSFDSGNVAAKDGQQIASFNRYGAGALSLTFKCSEETQSAVLSTVLTAVRAFIADTTALVDSTPVQEAVIGI